MAADDDVLSTDEPPSVVCANGHPLTPDKRFCPECGSAAQSGTPRMCPSGHEAEPDANYCSECGQPVAAQGTALPLPPSSEPDHDPPSVGGSRPGDALNTAEADAPSNPTSAPEEALLQRREEWAKLDAGASALRNPPSAPTSSYVARNTPGNRPPRPRGNSHRKIWVIVSVTVLLVTAIVIALVLGHSGSHGGQSISYRDGYASSGDTVVGGTPIDCSTDWTWDMPSGDNQAQWIAGCQAGQNAANYNAEHPGANGG